MEKGIIESELNFKFVRSSGAGGQNVNKVASKAELSFDLMASQGLTEDEKNLLVETISNRLTKENILLMQCDESRSQHKNKELIIQRFFELLEEGLIVQKERVPTKIPRAVVKKRLKAKRKLSEKKANRKPPEIG